MSLGTNTVDLRSFCMSFWIEFLKGRDIIDSRPWQGDLASAKEQAVARFAIHQKQLDATSVRVIDSRGQKIVFVLPETMPLARAAAGA
jgi:hypothetical protein